MSSVFLLRRSRQALLKSHAALCADGSVGPWHCSGSSDSWRDALPALCQQRPELLVCDLRLVDGPAGALLRRLPTPLPRVLLLTPMADDPLLFETLAGGAHAYCLERDSDALGQALHALAARRATISPTLARQLLQAFELPRSGLQLAQCVSAGRQDEGEANGLSRSQQHLLSLFAHGLLEEEIAQRWQLPREEIGSRVAAIYESLHRLPTAPVGAALAAGGG